MRFPETDTKIGNPVRLERAGRLTSVVCALQPDRSLDPATHI